MKARQHMADNTRIVPPTRLIPDRRLPLLALLTLALALATLPAADAVHAQQTPPGNPHLLNLQAEGGHQKVTLTWDAAPDDERARITGYEVQHGTSFSAMHAATWSAIAGSDSSTTTHTVTGLTNGTAYYFSVRATGPGGAGLVSPHVQATPYPGVTSIAVTSSPEKSDTYGPGEEIEVTVTFSEAMTVTGVPFLRLNVGGSYQPALYDSGSGSAALVFAYEVQDLDKDTDGVSIPQDPIIRAGLDGTAATIRNASGVDTITNHPGLSDQASHKVDGQLDNEAPTIFELGIFSVPPVDDSGEDQPYTTGNEIAVYVTFTETVVVVGTPTLDVTIGTSTKSFSYDANSALFTYTVQAGDADADGISIAANSLDVPTGASIKDKAGNNAVVTHAALTAQADHKVSTTVGGL